MDGIFRKGLNRLYGILGTVSGIGLIGLMGFVFIVDPAVKPGDVGYFVFFMIFGLIAAAVSIYSLLVTKRVFLRVTQERIEGFSGLSGRLDCAMSEVAHVAWGGTGLNLELKNGKRYNFNDLLNNHELGSFIREQTFVAPKVDMDREKLAQSVIGLKRKNSRLAICVLVSVDDPGNSSYRGPERRTGAGAVHDPGLDRPGHRSRSRPRDLRCLLYPPAPLGQDPAGI